MNDERKLIEITSRIFIMHDQKVMLDRDLSELYGVELKALNQAVKRNQERFPIDFMFQLNSNELDTPWESTHSFGVVSYRFLAASRHPNQIA